VGNKRASNDRVEHQFRRMPKAVCDKTVSFRSPPRPSPSACAQSLVMSTRNADGPGRGGEEEEAVATRRVAGYISGTASSDIALAADGA